MKTPGDFRVLLVYPNLTMMLVPSLAIAQFTGIFHKAGYKVDLFDSTHYVSDLTCSPENRVKFLQYRPFDAEKDLNFRLQTDLIEDFVRKVDEREVLVIDLRCWALFPLHLVEEPEREGHVKDRCMHQVSSR